MVNDWYGNSIFWSIVWNGISQVKVNYCKQRFKNKVMVCQNSVGNHLYHLYHLSLNMYVEHAVSDI